MERVSSILPWPSAALVLLLLGGCVETADYGTAENTAENADPTSANDTVTNTNTGTGQDTNTNTENGPVEEVVVLASDPVNGAARIRSTADLTITLQGNPNPDTLIHDRVTLKVTGSDVAVAADVSYDEATTTLTIDPREPLSYATSYTLSMSGAKDALGNALEEIATFRTYNNPVTHITNYDVATGAVSDYTVYEYKDDVLTRTVTYDGAGDDGDWSKVEDNVVEKYHGYVLDAEGRVFRVVAYGPGPNGKWLDDDDEVVSYVEYRRDVNGVLSGEVNFVDPGKTKQGDVEIVDEWFNNTDVVGEHIGYVNDSDGNRVKAVAYSDATTITWWEAIKYETDGSRRLWHFDGRRPDNWGESYNESVAFTEITPTEDNAGTVTSMRAMDWGGDSKWFTADDVVGSYVRTTRATGYMRRIEYSSAGGDGTWFDGDDTVNQYTEIVYNAADNRESETVYANPGADGFWFVDDDGSRTVIEYDPTR